MLIHYPWAVWKVVQKCPAAATHCSRPLNLPQDHVVFPPVGGEAPRPPPLPAGHTLLGEQWAGTRFLELVSNYLQNANWLRRIQVPPWPHWSPDPVNRAANPDQEAKPTFALHMS